MEPSQTVQLYITFLEKEGPFLKIWGQTEKNNSIYVEQFLLGASTQFDLGIGKIQIESLHVGTLVCAKYKDNKYYRARIINNSLLPEGLVEVNFLDYGNKDLVPCNNIRSLQNFPTTFISIPPLALGFIFAETHCVGGGEWNDTIFETISKELKYREVQCTLLIQATQYYLVKLFVDGTDLCNLLIQRGLMQPISLQAQQAVLLSMSMQKQISVPHPQTAHINSGINTYKACTLEPGCLYPVYVSYVNDGPCHFSIQLKQSEDVLVKLMNEINSIPLRPLDEVPIPGTICLAKCEEDGNICRAVVTNEVDNQFKVFYVDFGNYEVVPLDALYQIPFKYVLPKVMAIRFALESVEKSTVTLEMQCAFKTFVDNRLLHMKVLPAPTRMAIPKCELWDPETKTSALDVVNRAARHAYPDPIPLNRGFSQLVKVSFVYSCNRFYVQLVNKESELVKLMNDLQESCDCNNLMNPKDIKVGLPCCALFDTDQQWYRVQVVEVIDRNSVKVRYIDYGNEEVVTIAQLKNIDGEQLTVLRPQAIECCLNGYQNMIDDSERDRLLDELILEGAFTMKVVEMLGKKALVELFDDSNYNVASLLLDKLAAAKSQISPVLTVQAGNKIEHKKSYHQQHNGPREQNIRQDRKPGHDRDWHNKTNDRNEKSWRQENREFRNYDRNSNDNHNESSTWRQNNKGFSPKHQSCGRTTLSNDDASNQGKSWNTTNTNANKNWSNTTDRPVNRNTNDNWSNKTDQDSFKSKRDRFNDDQRTERGNRFSGKPRDSGFKKKSDFRDSSDVSSSGSEHSFQRGPRTNSRNSRDNGKFQKNSSRPSSTNMTSDESWNVSAVPEIARAPPFAQYQTYEVFGTEEMVSISWFHNPVHFYVQLISHQETFRKLMEDIQQFYKYRKPEKSAIGSPVIGLFPEDNVLYRAQLLDVLGSEYKVYYVDFGNVSTINKIWPIDKKFMELPAQAIACSLNGVKPPGNSWPEADTYSQYFDKDAFKCKFVNKDEERTYVNIFYNDEDITNLLLRENLLSSIESPSLEIEIPLLCGQQFRGVVKSVNNLEDIIIALECGLAVCCCMHNLSTATKTHENILKGLLEQTVIVFVDDVIKDKLEITLYDTDGNKYAIIDPDETAFDNIEPLCPILILHSTITGIITHIDERSVYIQPKEYTDKSDYLIDQMFEHYEKIEQDSTIIPDEEHVYAVQSEDGNWYRGRAIGFDDDKATIQYVDYGNLENVEFTALRELDPKFKEICILCLQVQSSGQTDAYIDKDVIAKLTYSELGWEGVLQIVETPSINIPVAETMETTADTALVASSNQEILEIPTVENDEIVETIPKSESYVESQKSPKGEYRGTRVVMSHVDTPNEFYLQLLEAVPEIKELQATLQNQIEEMLDLHNPIAGILCAAPFSLDQQWYRAEVLDADDDITTVRFVDFGNTDVIDNNVTKVKALLVNLLSLALYATRCSLNVLPVEGSEWNTSVIECFQELTTGGNLTVEFLDQDEKTNYVELYINGKNVKEILVQKNLAVPVNQSTESKQTGFVSHLNSPSEFWMQLENCIDELEWIAEQLSTAESFPELEDLTPGTLCAALFPDDQMWYRARILSNTVGGIELLFIDYGNSCTSSNLRMLPEDLILTPPPLAQKCSLQKPESIINWSPQMTSKFSEISAEGQTIFTVKKISTGETSVVQLLLDNKDVVERLLPNTEDGYVKNIESLEKFNLEKNEELLLEEYKLEKPSGATWNEDSIEQFAELNNEGTTLFQIEFLPENMVRLYHNGKDIRFNLCTIKSTLNVSKCDENETEIETTVLQNDSGELTPDEDVTLITKDNCEIEKTHEDLTGIKISDGDIIMEKIEITTTEDNEKVGTSDVPEGNDLTTYDTLHEYAIRIDNEKNDFRGIPEENVIQNEDENQIDNGKNCSENIPEGTNLILNANEDVNQIDNKEVIPGDISEGSDLKSNKNQLDNETINPQDIPKENAIQKEHENQVDNKEVISENMLNENALKNSRNEDEKGINNEIVISDGIPGGNVIQNEDRITQKLGSTHKEVLSHSKLLLLDTKEVSPKASEDINNIDRIIESKEKPGNSEQASPTASPKSSGVLEEIELEQNQTCNAESLVKDEAILVTTNETNSPNTSRPASRNSAKFNHDDRVLPGFLSRPETPVNDDSFIDFDSLEVASILNTISEGKSQERPSSACGKIKHEDKILPASVSRPHTPPADDKEKV